LRIACPLFVPPIVFLALVAIAYAMVPWACETQRRWALHVVSFVAVVIVAGCVHLAWRNWRSLGTEPTYDNPEITVWVRFIAGLGLALSALVTVGTIALWATQFILPPCVRG
jgi:hypothetical protein